MSDLLNRIGDHILAGQTEALGAALAEALEANMTARQILDQAMMPAMDRLGERFAAGEAFLPELLLAGETMKDGLAILGPKLVSDGPQAAGTLVIGTVQGDIHDLGKNLVKMMFEGAGFRVVDLGANVPTERFLAACAQEKPDLVGLSSLLTNTMAVMKQVIRTVRDAHPQVRFLVGGAPLSQDFADRIGADGYAPDAHNAVKAGKALIGPST